MLDKNYILKLVDFGLAKVTKKGAKSTPTTGTHGYLPPKLAEATEWFEYHGEVDVYAAGRTVLELIKGYLPEELKLPKGEVLRVFRGVAGSVTTAQERMVKKFADLVEEMMCTDSEDYPTSEEAHDELHGILEEFDAR